MNTITNFTSYIYKVCKVREYPNLPAASPPAYVASILLGLASFLIYFLGGLPVELNLRYSSLAMSACAVFILLLHLVHPNAARWSIGPATTLLVFFLAYLWQNPALLFFAVIPILLSAVFVNIPAILLIAALQTLFIINFPVSPEPERGLLLMAIWLFALTIGGGYYFIDSLLTRTAQDYHRFQDLLSQSRDQQQRLSMVLDDLAHANRQLSLLYDKNIALRKTAEEATEAKSNYIAKVSHEIRTPLNMILGVTESIIENQDSYENDLPLDLVDDIKVIRRNSEHLLSLVNDVLDLTRAETSRMILRKEWVDMAQEIEKSIEIVQPLAVKKHIGLEFMNNLHPPQIYCDRTRIRQVILNLLSNAVRYTNQGKVSVHMGVDRNWLTVAVRDTGPGIENDDLEKIFEPFYRGIASAKEGTIGTGLGLSVCRQLVDLHGGKIWLESQLGKGSSFFFRLPVTQDIELDASPVRYINPEWVWVERKRSYNFQKPGKKRVIVYGYDEQLHASQSALDNQVEIIPVDTIDTLEREASETPAHMVIINASQAKDLLPAMQKAARLVEDTPIIGSAFNASQNKIRQTGAFDYVQKPFSNQRLRQAVERVEPYPRKILVVDDNPEMQRLIVRILSTDRETTQYLLADNGVMALEVVRRRRPDLILLDLALPEMDGWQVLQAVKEDPAIQDIPVILVSAHDVNEGPPRSEVVILMNDGGISLEQFHNLMETGIVN